MTSPFHIVVVGSINVDFLIGVAALPKPNETLLGHSSFIALGGKGMNQAVAAKSMDINTHMVAAVGADSFGQEALAFLRGRGVGLDHVHVLAEHSTGMANVVVASGGENMIIVSPGANAHLAPQMVEEAADLIRTASAVITQLESPLSVIRRALEIARSHQVLTILNPAPVDPAAVALFPLVDLLTPNETELAKLTGIDGLDDASLAQAMLQLQSKGAGQVVVTLGDKGCATLIDGQVYRVKAFDVKAVDATGAGDVFNGVLASQLVEGQSLVEAMRFACAASALSVATSSANAAPRRQQVEAFLSSVTT
jgi:ribokinase